jgi:hypothetical protein
MEYLQGNKVRDLQTLRIPTLGVLSITPSFAALYAAFFVPVA